MSAYPQDIEFEIIKENWNEYELSDGAILKTKLVLGKVLCPPGATLETTVAFNFQTQNMIIAYVPTKMKGTPIGRHLTPEEIRDSIVEDLDFEPKKEVWNEYKLPNNINIKLKLMLTRVAKTDKFAPDGAPIYATSTQVVPRIKLPKGFRKKAKRKPPKTPIV